MEQAIELLGDEAVDVALEVATEVALESEKNVSAEETIAAQSHAKQIIKNDAEGLDEFRKFAETLGLPANRAIFYGAIDHANCKGTHRSVLRSDAKRVLEPEGVGKAVGSMEFKMGGTDGKTLHLLLDACGPTHDIGAELAKADPHLSEEGRQELRKQCSFMISVARQNFVSVINSDEGLILVRAIAKWRPYGLDPEKFIEEMKKGLVVDPRNTTLCVHPQWPTRAGLFLRPAQDKK